MLVLSRRESERIRLGDSIVVTVIRVVGDRVRLGIEAPSDVLVLRDELEPRPDERPLTLASGLPPAVTFPLTLGTCSLMFTVGRVPPQAAPVHLETTPVAFTVTVTLAGASVESPTGGLALTFQTPGVSARE